MIKLSRDDFLEILVSLLLCTAKVPTNSQTTEFIDYLYNCYKENKHIITIGIR